MSITFYDGRRPPHPESTHPRVKLAPALDRTVLPAPPAEVDWHSEITDWPMYGNDSAGDCVEAEQGHHEQVLSLYGAGGLITVSEADVIGAYSAITGYDPADPSTDQGTVIQDALNYWRKTGLGGHKIAAFAEVDVKDEVELKTALALFGPLSIGVNFPASAMDQFNAGEPWRVLVHDGGIDGGHCVCLVGYDDVYYYVITWGAVQRVTPAWWRKYVEEAWAPVSAEWVSSKTGLDPRGVDLHGLGDQFAQLTGQANPFPEPGPAPTPEPAPVPVDVADQALVDVVGPWLRLRHRGINADVAQAFTTWRAAKHL